MYTAIQAKNIAMEHMNHIYYKLYKRRVRYIMAELTRRANYGGTAFRFNAKRGDKMEIEVLEQIAAELNQIGYQCNVYNETTESGTKNWYLNIQWEGV